MIFRVGLWFASLEESIANQLRYRSVGLHPLLNEPDLSTLLDKIQERIWTYNANFYCNNHLFHYSRCQYLIFKVRMLIYNAKVSNRPMIISTWWSCIRRLFFSLPGTGSLEGSCIISTINGMGWDPFLVHVLLENCFTQLSALNSYIFMKVMELYFYTLFFSNIHYYNFIPETWYWVVRIWLSVNTVFHRGISFFL